jgi:hypothetical protein
MFLLPDAKALVLCSDRIGPGADTCIVPTSCQLIIFDSWFPCVYILWTSYSFSRALRRCFFVGLLVVLRLSFILVLVLVLSRGRSCRLIYGSTTCALA